MSDKVTYSVSNEAGAGTEHIQMVFGSPEEFYPERKRLMNVLYPNPETTPVEK